MVEEAQTAVWKALDAAARPPYRQAVDTRKTTDENG
jgi:hypothetical protein